MDKEQIEKQIEQDVLLNLWTTLKFNPEIKEPTEILEKMLISRKIMDYCRQNPLKIWNTKCLISYQFETNE
jgi:hypothetical protein